MAYALTRTSRQLIIYKKSNNFCTNFRQYTLRSHNTSKLDKRFLVLTGRYNSVEEVPQYVSPDAIQKSRSKIQIVLANLMILMTIVGSYLMIMNEKSRKKPVANPQTEELYQKINEYTLQDPIETNLQVS